MVKPLRHCLKIVKLLLLAFVLGMIGLAIWLHADQRNLAFARPWIMASINTPDAPYVITIGDVSIDWRNAVELGEVRIANVSFAKRDGNVFAQLPEVYVTIDPIGFLPMRRMIHTVKLHGPRLFITRTMEGAVELGLEGAPSRMRLSDLFASATGEAPSDTGFAPPDLPFHAFSVDGATLTFSDMKSDTKIVSTPMAMRLVRRSHYFNAAVSMPLMIEDKPVIMMTDVTTRRDGSDHVFQANVKQFPAQFICMFAACPDKTGATGLLDAQAWQRIGADKKLGAFKLALITKDATVNAPDWFPEPLKFGPSGIEGTVNWQGPDITLSRSHLVLPDTTINASGNVHKAADGWYATANGEASRLEVTQIYKYWPLFLAPDSRAWIVQKLKSGYAAKGTLRLDMKPADFTDAGVSDSAVDAMADARDITFEYLPGFPLVEKMSGIAHFTGKTVRVTGGGGGLLSGTKIGKAELWCPELDNPKNPMEATVEVVAPAADAASLLALKYFTFDDALGLDPKTIRGTVDATMKLKFNAFSDKPQTDPNEIHLESVTYDIATKLVNIAQDKLAGAYDAKAINGELKASNAGMNFKGSVAVGQAPASDVTLAQMAGKPLTLQAKSRDANAGNDFTLSYQPAADGAVIDLRGKRLDASVPYGGSTQGSILKNFPAMHLNVALDTLLLAADTPITNVAGTLDCSAARCEAADFKAKIGNSSVKGGIVRSNGRKFLLYASDAGSFVRALALSDRMVKGKFSMSGTYDDSKTPPELKARITINDFTLKNAQVLGRILSIGSLTGLQNALTGSGISFDKLIADITTRAGFISITKGLANGNALGITVAGTVDMNSTKLNLKGVVVPAYALNSIFGKIPIIGLIAGGEGEGLIAFNYSVTGTFETPDVGVNPLSGLTPGFLRGIFTIFDDKPSATKDNPSRSTSKTTDDGGFTPMHKK